MIHLPVSDLERLQTWAIALKAWWVHPWLGWGPDNFYEAFRAIRPYGFIALMQNQAIVQGDAHNWMLQSLATLGVIGAVASIILIVSIFRNLGNDQYSVAVKAGLLGYLAQGMFEPLTFAPLALASCLAGSCVMACGLKQKSKRLIPMAAIAAVMAGMMFSADICYTYRYYRTMVILDFPNTEHIAEYCVALFNKGFKKQDGAALVRANHLAKWESRVHPNDPLVHLLYADSAYFITDLDTAKREIEIASRLDPISPIIQKRKKVITSAHLVRVDSPRFYLQPIPPTFQSPVDWR